MRRSTRAEPGGCWLGCSFFAGKQSGEFCLPFIYSLPHLRLEIIFLVHPDDTSERSGYVVEKLLGHFKSHAE